MDKLIRSIPDSLVESLQDLARHHKRSLNGEIIVALEQYADQGRQPVKYGVTKNIADVLAIKHQLIDGKIIVKAHALGRTVHVVMVDKDASGNAFITASWSGWQENRFLDANDVEEFFVYSERQYAAMLDAVREKEDR